MGRLLFQMASHPLILAVAGPVTGIAVFYSCLRYNIRYTNGCDRHHEAVVRAIVEADIQHKKQRARLADAEAAAAFDT